MHAVLDSKDLEKVLKWHLNGSALREIKVTVADEHLVMESSGPDAWRRTTLPVSEGVDGEAALIWVRLADQLRVGRGGHVEISQAGNAVVTKVGRSTAQTPSLPEMRSFWSPTEPLVDVAEADLGDLEWAFRTCAVTAARVGQKGAEALTGVQVEVGDSRITLSSTDTWRLGQASLECMTSQAGTWLVTPAALVNALSMMGDPARLVTSGGHLGFADDRSAMLSITLAAAFPKISGSLDKARKIDTHVVVCTRDILDALASSGSGARSQVVVQVGENSVTISNRVSGENDQGLTETVLDAEVHGMAGATFILNDSYLAGMLKTTRSDRICLAATSGNCKMPLAIREHGAEGNSSEWLGVLALVAA